MCASLEEKKTLIFSYDLFPLLSSCTSVRMVIVFLRLDLKVKGTILIIVLASCVSGQGLQLHQYFMDMVCITLLLYQYPALKSYKVLL